jgi:hypothetical protein
MGQQVSAYGAHSGYEAYVVASGEEPVFDKLFMELLNNLVTALTAAQPANPCAHRDACIEAYESVSSNLGSAARRITQKLDLGLPEFAQDASEPDRNGYRRLVVTQVLAPLAVHRQSATERWTEVYLVENIQNLSIGTRAVMAVFSFDDPVEPEGELYKSIGDYQVEKDLAEQIVGAYDLVKTILHQFVEDFKDAGFVLTPWLAGAFAHLHGEQWKLFRAALRMLGIDHKTDVMMNPRENQLKEEQLVSRIQFQSKRRTERAAYFSKEKLAWHGRREQAERQHIMRALLYNARRGFPKPTDPTMSAFANWVMSHRKVVELQERASARAAQGSYDAAFSVLGYFQTAVHRLVKHCIHVRPCFARPCQCSSTLTTCAKTKNHKCTTCPMDYRSTSGKATWVSTPGCSVPC